MYWNLLNSIEFDFIMNAFMYECIYECTHVCVYTYIYIYMCVYVCIVCWMYIELYWILLHLMSWCWIGIELYWIPLSLHRCVLLICFHVDAYGHIWPHGWDPWAPACMKSSILQWLNLWMFAKYMFRDVYKDVRMVAPVNVWTMIKPVGRWFVVRLNAQHIWMCECLNV